MPNYVYVHVDGAGECLEDREVYQHMSEDPLTECPDCGRGVRRSIRATAQLKEDPRWSGGWSSQLQGYYDSPASHEKILERRLRDGSVRRVVRPAEDDEEAPVEEKRREVKEQREKRRKRLMEEAFRG